MTELRRAHALLANLDALRGIIDAVPHPIFVKDEESRFLVVNRIMCEIMRRSFDDLVGHRDHDFVPAEQADVFRANDLLVLETGEPNTSEEAFTDGSGMLRTVITRKKRLVLADGVRLVVGSLTDITEFRRAEALIRHHAEHDHLTGLANRGLFQRCLRDAILDAEEDSRASLALLLVDLDGFKNVNDLLGHAAGDSLLVQTASILTELCGDRDLVARFGGDEFAIIRRGGDELAAAALAADIIDRLSRPLLVGGRQVEISASVGIAGLVQEARPGDAGTLLRHADLALYGAKKDGRNAWRLFEPAMEAVYLANRFLEDDLRSSVEHGHFALDYQPFYGVHALDLLGFETLLRWRHPLRGELPPSEFIITAERTGLIVPIGEWALRAACTDAATWPCPLRVSVNISPVQFAQADLPTLVRSVVRDIGIDPRRIELGLTETAVIKDIGGARRVFRALHDIGVNLVLDDFGAGYSSLQILKSLPFDKIKIDRSLLQDVGRTERADAIIGAILRLARTLNLVVVAEGVETVEQLAVLWRERCDEVQGFLLGRPRPIHEFGDTFGAPSRAMGA